MGIHWQSIIIKDTIRNLEQFCFTHKIFKIVTPTRDAMYDHLMTEVVERKNKRNSKE